MLCDLHIRNLVIVEELALSFASGMTVLTGETGAGKSVLVDAVGLALGDRAESGVIREGAERMEVNAVFELLDNEPAQQWLRGRDLGTAEACVLRRVLSRTGRSRAYINERPVPLQALQELGDMLLSIHGQHSHYALLRTDHQRRLVDDFGDHAELLAETAQLYSRWRAASEGLHALQQATAERTTRRGLLEYQVRELDELQLKPDELDELENEHRRLTNIETLQRLCQAMLEGLEGAEGTGARDVLNGCVGNAARLLEFNGAIGNVHELLQEAVIHVDEAVSELRDFAASLEADPASLAEIEQRLGRVHDLARKHKVRAAELIACHAALADELAALEQGDIRLDALEREVETLQKRYFELAHRLSEARQRAAAPLAEAVTELIRQLGMPSGSLEVDVTAADPIVPTACGIDRIAFLVRTNPGQAAAPLGKVASGGELSRIGLAIDVVTARSRLIPTLIFDEVDVGVGGGVAEIIGRLMRRLGEARQVLCVTHLPQVASQANHHLLVKKQIVDGTTQARIVPLSAGERVSEVARMLGGVEITPQTLAHADEMISRAQSV